MERLLKGSPLAVLPQVQEFVERYGIGRIEPDRIVLCSDRKAITWCSPPARLIEDGGLRQGLSHLKLTRPKVLLLLTPHYAGSDFDRLAEICETYLLECPVAGVEARAEWPHRAENLSPPAFSDYNPWLWAFQRTQFPWFDNRGITMLPVEPEFGKALDEHWDFLSNALQSCRKGVVGLPEAAGAHISRIVIALRGIYRAWGLLAQFGILLQHAQVAKLCKNKNMRYPLILGAAHTYEMAILREYCGIDVVTINLDTKLDEQRLNAHGGNYNVAEANRWGLLYRQEVATGSVLIRDLEVPLVF